MERHPTFMDLEGLVLLTFQYMLHWSTDSNTIPIKITAAIFAEIDKLILNS